MDWALAALGGIGVVALVAASVAAGQVAARLFVEESRKVRGRRR